MAKELDKVRNIGVMAHIDAGKTTVSERILYFAGRTYKMGEVHYGTAVMDYLPEEQERGITITSAATRLEWNGYTVNLIDTPGHVDFTIEVERSLRVLDGAIAVFCGVGGVEAQTETVWRQADRYRVPRLCFINKLDRVGADFQMVVDEISSRLHAGVMLVQFPMGQAEKFVGQIDLVRMKAYFYDNADVGTTLRIADIPAEYNDEAQIGRHDLIEKAAEFDDALMEKYLHDRPVEPAELIAALRKATLTVRAFPLLCGSALRHIGIHPLLDAVIDYLPSPADIPPVQGHLDLRGDKIVTRRSDPQEPFSALVFKIISDQHGDLNFIRLYSGRLESGTRVLNSTQDRKENISRLWEMHAKQRLPCQEAQAGDIVAVIGLKHSITGDTLCDTRHPIILERLDFPEPVISMSIEPQTNADKQKLGEALATLRREDPSFSFSYDSETGQTVISGMGELHLEILKNKLTRDMGLAVRVGRPKVAYKETIRSAAQAEGRFIKQTGGHGQYGVAVLRVEPFQPADDAQSPIDFEDDTKGGSVPKEYIRAVEEGVRSAATAGPLAGYPMLNIRAILIDGKHHPVDSSELAFQQAGALAFTEAVRKASPVFLEPMMRLSVTTPEEYLGAVTGDLNSRRVQITHMEQRSKYRIVEALAPLAEMFGYTTQLRSLTQGRATSTMEPHSYATAPASATEMILKYA
ncbi:MAG: elongation factor G [Planctomycetes bacterium]|nr:elongation factor G [Planctomycetota bacterium]